MRVVSVREGLHLMTMIIGNFIFLIFLSPELFTAKIYINRIKKPRVGNRIDG